MRIVQLVTRRQRRGAETFAAQLSDALAERGCDVTLIGLYDPPADALVPTRARFLDIGRSTARPLNPRVLNGLSERLADLRPEIVQANGSDTLKYSVLAKRRLGARWPLIYRNISIGSRWLRYPGHRVWVRWLLKQVDFTVAVSELARIDLEQAFALPPERLRTIPIGTAVPDDPRRDVLRQRLAAEIGVSVAAELLIHVGSFTPEKNHLWLVECFESVQRRRKDAHLVLVGDGELRPRVGAHVRERGLSGHVHLLGLRPDAAELTAGADLLLLPSLIEGIPGVILEAAAHGTPCVATDVGSIKEAVVDGVTGTLIPSGDRVRFADAVVSLLDDHERRHTYGAEARRFVGQRFAISAVVDAFHALYADLLDRSGPDVHRSPRPVHVGRYGGW